VRTIMRLILGTVAMLVLAARQPELFAAAPLLAVCARILLLLVVAAIATSHGCATLARLGIILITRD